MIRTANAENIHLSAGLYRFSFHLGKIIRCEWNRVHVAIINSFGMQARCARRITSLPSTKTKTIVDDDLNERTKLRAFFFLHIYFRLIFKCVWLCFLRLFKRPKTHQPFPMNAFTFLLSHIFIWMRAAFAKRFRILVVNRTRKCDPYRRSHPLNYEWISTHTPDPTQRRSSRSNNDLFWLPNWRLSHMCKTRTRMHH